MYRVYKLSILALAIIFILSCAYLCFAKLSVSTNMMSLLPKERGNFLKEKAFNYASKEASQKIIILIGNSSREESYQEASFFYKKISKFFQNEDIQFQINSGDARENLINLYTTYRYQILSPKYREFLLNHNGDKIRNESRLSLYSPLGMAASNLKEDPFLLTNNLLINLPFLQSALFPYKDALMAKFDEKYYTFLTIALPQDEIFSTNKLAQKIKAIKKSEQETKLQFSNSDIVLSGVPIHSYAGSKQGIKEVSTIGWLSIIGTLLLVYFNFHSLKPLALIAISFAISFVIGFAITHLVFGEIHIITLIFGASLIGISSDYAIHFFCEYLNHKENGQNSGKLTLKHIFPGITLGLITTIFGYIGLIFTPFSALKQIALFSTIGFSVSYLVVILIFPKFYKTKNFSRSPILLNFAESFSKFSHRIVSKKAIYYLVAISALIVASSIPKMHFNDDIRLLYSSPQSLIDSEIKSRKIMGNKKAFQFFLIEAQSPQNLLEKEEDFTSNLDKLISSKNIESYQAISQIVPSIKRQTENHKLIKQELINPHLKNQSQFLGIKTKKTSEIKEYLTIDKIIKNQSLKMMSFLWIGKIEDKYASIILLDGINNLAELKKLNDEKNGIYLMDKVEDISNIFKDYRTTSLALLIASYAVIAILLFYRYGKKFIFVLMPPILAGILTLSFISLLNYPINLFNILGLFLILGIGVDYTIFYAEDKKRSPTTTLGVLIATISTLLSFGLLALSGFAVIHSFGITILIGMTLAYLLAPVAILTTSDRYKRS